ncbi:MULTISPECIES: hypothetical protein [unclassified Microbacterium]|uniref:DUF7169 domain-containing protein n=1 Tax=unclassified Microbacterium TaxID=2609290 RepID=UPI0003FF0BFA|nr:hypothetical protein [Microbacterium sp. B24]
MTLSHRDLFDNLAAAAGHAAKSLVASSAIQWQPGARLRGEGGGKSSGTVSDPTFAVVSDARRLKVRAAVVAAERDLDRAARVLSARARQLDLAIEAHEDAD